MSQEASTLWYYCFPGSLSNGPVRFSQPKTEPEFRAYLRWFFELARLPHGLEVWPTTEKEYEAMLKNNEEQRRDLPAWAR